MGSSPVFTNSRFLISSPDLSCWDPNTVQQCLLLLNCKADTYTWEGHFLDFILRAALGSGPACAFSPFNYSALHILPCSSSSARIPFSVVSEPVYHQEILTARPFDFSHMFVSTFPCSASSPHWEQATQKSQLS